MRQYILLIAIVISNKLFSQKIFSTDYKSQADISVFVTDYESLSDLKVFKVNYQSQAKENKGFWYFVNYPFQADKKIYFVKYQSQAGWRQNSKKHLMF